MARATCLTYTVATVCTALPVVVVLLALSQLSPWSPAVLRHLIAVPPLAGRLLIGVVFIGTSVFWLARRGLPPTSYWAAWWSLLGLAIFSAILLAPVHPVSSIPGLLLLGPILLHPLRRLVYKDVSLAAWCRVQSVATGLTATTSLLAWLAWVLVGFPGRELWFDWPPAFSSLVVDGAISWKLAFVLWACPVGAALLLGLLSVIYWVRQHYLRLHADDDRQAFIDFSLKQLLGWLVVLAMLLWIGASLSATEERKDMRDETVYLAFWTFVCLGVWITASYGEDVFVTRGDDTQAMVEAWKILHNDWTKGFILLLGAVPICLYAMTFHMVRCARSGGQAGAPGASEELPTWPLMEHLSHWHWSDVVVKAQWIGVIYVVLIVMFGKLTLLLLSATSELVATLPVFTVSLIIFLIGFVIFMFPSSPAGPIYVLMGVVIIQSSDQHGWSYEAGLAWATLVTFAVKLAFTAATQKWVGEPLGQKCWVRRNIGVHTPYMRAVEEILQEDMTLAKVAVLCGGPDWPVAVVCGILKLRVLPVLVAISPVLLQSVFPCVLSGTLLYYQNVPHSGGGIAEHILARKGLAEASLILAAVLQFATGLVAFLCIQEVLEKDYDRLSQLRPEDRWLQELDEKEALDGQQLRQLTKWGRLPRWLRAVLSLGLLSIEAGLLLLSGPWHDLFGASCFRSFDLMNSVHEDLGGNPLRIVKPLGWVAFALTGVSMLCLAAFYSFQRSLDVDAAARDFVPLLSKTAQPAPAAPSGAGRAVATSA